MNMKSLLTIAFLTIAFSPLVSAADTPDAPFRKALIDQFECNDAPVADALKIIEEKSGLKVFYVPAADESGRVSLSMRNMPASELLRFIAAMAGSQVTYEADGAHLRPLPAPSASEPKK